jgi:hypothetical protein
MGEASDAAAFWDRAKVTGDERSLDRGRTSALGADCQPSAAVSNARELYVECFGADPELRELSQVSPIGAGNVILLPRLGAQDVLAADPRLYAFNELTIDQHRAVNPDKSVRLQL